MEKVEVLVVGAGPVGSVGAARLASMGIDVMLCEAHPTNAHDLRASTFHAATLEMLDAIDAAQPLIEQGLKAPVYNVRDRQSGDTLSFDLTEIADRTPFPYRLQCEQYYMAKLLSERLAALPGGRVHFATRLLHAHETAEGIEAVLERDGQQVTVQAQFLVGADGAHSRVRELMDVEFEGFTWEEKFVSLSTAYPIEQVVSGLSWVNYISDPDEWLVLLRVPRFWRVLVPASVEDDDAWLISDAKAAEVFGRIVGDVAVETGHRTIYRVHQRVARSFVKGRMLLAGDAAHLNNPLGGFGMNSGVHDVWNLADKLYAILRGDGDAEQLARYDRQRRTVTRNFIQAQSIENKAMMEEGGNAANARRARLERIHADPALRRAYLLRQAMFQSLEEAEAVQ
jgi:3-(3-hydroxy-phenyl)propionate hydroxylase